MRQLIDWSLLEQHLGHHFEESSSPPFKLTISLLYLKAMDDISYEETLDKWDESANWQYFCGCSRRNEKRPIRASTLSIWNREIGDIGNYWMGVAISKTPQQSKTFH